MGKQIYVGLFWGKQILVDGREQLMMSGEGEGGGG